ncbi:MAG: type II toxin-antitoxin system Phd/YefM family antitoxin [Propionibacteriaceae bacterium]|jgi:antitoxin (DNA-binding transcriptional repressor) of toxin-antitoxin stability system|nr:type II toxin-antitoxin system Phd/YefM family antitoxin [Propionibacteriaceae bacterium]
MANVATLDGLVGLREFRAHLSSYLEQVKAGRTLTLTEHETPVAQLRPLPEQSNYEKLVAAGIVQRAKRSVSIDPPVVAGGIVSDLVGEQRR